MSGRNGGTREGRMTMENKLERYLKTSAIVTAISFFAMPISGLFDVNLFGACFIFFCISGVATMVLMIMDM